MGRAILQITPALVREILCLPYTASVEGSRQSSDYVEVIVSDPGLPESHDATVPIVHPTFRKNVPVEFVDWGIEK